MTKEPTTEKKMVRRKRRKKLSWGGVRPGAGRPRTIPESATVRHIRLTNDELVAVKQFVHEMRQSANGSKSNDELMVITP